MIKLQIDLTKLRVDLLKPHYEKDKPQEGGMTKHQ
jgi:hypothetical protein